MGEGGVGRGRRLGAVLAVAGGLLALVPVAGAADNCPGTGADATCPWLSSAAVGNRADGTFRFPQAVAADAAGNVYVGDHYSGVIQVFTAAGVPVRQWGANGTGDGELGQVGGIAIDPATGDVYVTDSETDRIEQFASDGTYRRSVGSHGTGPAQLDLPTGPDADAPAGGGVAIANGALYVADSGNDRITRFPITAAAGGADATQASVLPITGLNAPQAIAFGPAGLYVADDDNHRLIVADENTGAVLAATAPGALDFPYGVAVDPAGNAYVANNNVTSTNHRVAVFGPPVGDGTFGPPTVATTGWGGFGTAVGRFGFPRDLVRNPATGQIVVADTANNRIQVFDPVGNAVVQWGASGRAPGQFTGPQRLFASPFGELAVADTFAYRAQVLGLDGTFLRATQTTMKVPGGTPDNHLLGLADVARAPDGSLVGLDLRTARIVRFDGVTGRQIAAYPTTATTVPGRARGGIAVDAAGNIWITDPIGDRLLEYDAAGNLIATSGAVGRALGQFDDPEGIRIDATGDLWVADVANNRVQRLSSTGQPKQALPYPGTSPPDAAPAIALDGVGRLYAASTARSRVIVLDTASGAQLARFGNRGTGPGQLDSPQGIAVQCDGTLVVADTENNRLQRFTLASAPPNACQAPPAPPPPPVTTTTAPPPVTTTPTPVLPIPPKPKPARIALALRSDAARILRSRSVSLRVGCDGDCAVVLRVTLAASTGPAFRLTVPARATALPDGRARTFRAALPRTAARVLAARLRRHHRHGLRLAVTVRAARTGATTATVNRTYRARG